MPNDCFCHTHPFALPLIIVGLFAFVILCFHVPDWWGSYSKSRREKIARKQKAKEKEVIDSATIGSSYRKASSKDIELAGEDFVRRSKEAASNLKLSNEAKKILEDVPEVIGGED